MLNDESLVINTAGAKTKAEASSKLSTLQEIGARNTNSVPVNGAVARYHHPLILVAFDRTSMARCKYHISILCNQKIIMFRS